METLSVHDPQISVYEQDTAEEVTESRSESFVARVLNEKMQQSGTHSVDTSTQVRNGGSATVSKETKKKNNENEHEVEECAICTMGIVIDDRAIFSDCAHAFCRTCAITWASMSNVCPVCRAVAENLVIPSSRGKTDLEVSVEEFNRLNSKNKTERTINYYVVLKPPKTEEEEEDLMGCTICSEYHSQELLLLCDYCERGFHTMCIDLGTYIPPGFFYCDECYKDGCISKIMESNSMASMSHLQLRRWRRAREQEHEDLMRRRRTNKNNMILGLRLLDDASSPSPRTLVSRRSVLHPAHGPVLSQLLENELFSDLDFEGIDDVSPTHNQGTTQIVGGWISSLSSPSPNRTSSSQRSQRNRFRERLEAYELD